MVIRILNFAFLDFVFSCLNYILKSFVSCFLVVMGNTEYTTFKLLPCVYRSSLQSHNRVNGGW